MTKTGTNTKRHEWETTVGKQDTYAICRTDKIRKGV